MLYIVLESEPLFHNPSHRLNPKGQPEILNQSYFGLSRSNHSDGSRSLLTELTCAVQPTGDTQQTDRLIISLCADSLSLNTKRQNYITSNISGFTKVLGLIEMDNSIQ